MTRTIALGLLGFALALPGTASAQRVGLEPFTGPRGAQVRALVRDALEERVTVVDVEPGDAGDVDARVRGQTSGRRSSPRLALTLEDRAGAERASESLRVVAGRRGRRAVARAVASLLDAAGSLEAPPEPTPIEETPRPASVAEEPTDESAPVESRPSSGTSARPYLHLLVGLSLRNRDLGVSLSTGRLVHAIPLYPEVLGEARVHPFLGTGEPLLAALRARLRFAYALFFESETPSGQVIGGGAWSIDGDLAWLPSLGDLAELGVVLGGGFTSYGLDDNAFVTTVEYGTFDARAATRIHAIDETLVIRAEAGYRLALGSGALADAYGTPTGHGIVVEGGLEGMIPFDENVGLSWLAAIEWSHTWLEFTGNAAQELASGGEERFVRGRFAVGISAR